MGFRIQRNEGIAGGLIRLAGNDLEAAIHDLSRAGTRAEREAYIHRTRQRLKRVRSVLRMLEPVCGEPARSARRSLAEAARMLAHTRDADVAAANARALAATAGQDLGFDRVASGLELAAAEAHHQKTPVAAVTERLRAVRQTIDRFPADFNGAAVVGAAMRRSYRRGRRALRRAETSLSTPDLHRWRKAVKDLWHILLLARKRLPKPARKTADRLEALGDLLGRDNDHALLAEKLALSPEADHKLMSQLGLIAQQRHALEHDAFAIGNRVYRHASKRFLRKHGLR